MIGYADRINIDQKFYLGSQFLKEREFHYL